MVAVSESAEGSEVISDFCMESPPSATTSASVIDGQWKPINVAIDLGLANSVAAGASRDTPLIIDVEPNRLANRNTPSVVSYENKLRVVGEAAEDKANAYPANTSTIFMKTIEISCQSELESTLQRFRWRARGQPEISNKEDGDREVIYHVKYGDQVTLVTAREVLSIYVREVVEFVKRNKAVTPAPSSNVNLCVAIPPSMSAVGTRNVRDACALAGYPDTRLIYQNVAIRSCWLWRNSKALLAREAFLAVGENFECLGPHIIGAYVVGFLDVGYGHTTFELVKIAPANDRLDVAVLASETTPNLGVVDLVNVLLDIAQDKIIADCGDVDGKIDLASKKGWRLGTACTKMLRDLSALPSATVELDVFLPHRDYDFSMTVTQEQLREVAAPIIDNFDALVMRTLKKAVEAVGADFTKQLFCPIGEDPGKCEVNPSVLGFCGVELVGGGSRIPFLQQCVDSHFVLDGVPSILRRTMDSSAAVAIGAALDIAKITWELPYEVVPSTQFGSDLSDIRTRLSHQEDIEAEEHKRREKFNELESYIVEIRSATVRRAELFCEVLSEINDLLNKTEDWIIDHDIDTATPQTYEIKLISLKEAMEPFLRNYSETIEAEAKKNAADMDKAASQQQNTEPEDKDDRKLPNSQRLHLAVKNKDEGNELFRGGNFELAVQRYLKALQHASKVFDASPQDAEKQRTITVALHLNLSQIYIKVGNEGGYKKAISSCNKALELDNTNIKALYRRATAYEALKQYDEALSDLLSSQATDPLNADVRRAVHRVQQLVKQEEGRARKMYARMMSTKAD